MHHALGHERLPLAAAAGDRSNDVISAIARLGVTTSGSSSRPGGVGKGIPPDVRVGLERALGHDFSQVRIHEGQRATRLGGTAFTQGNDIHFEVGKYSPRSLEGRRLLTHELAHVVQQRSARVPRTRNAWPDINMDPVLEAEAETAAKNSHPHVVTDAARSRVSTHRRIRPAGPSTLMNPDSRPTAWGAAAGPIQLNRHKKRFLNVITLGIRKAITSARKRRAAQAQVQPVPDPSESKVVDPLDQFVEAYGKSRYYQQTNPIHHPSIEQHGLLNYNDRVSELGEDVRGMSLAGGHNGEFAGDEKKGVFLGGKKFMREEGMTKNLVRAYLPRERTRLSPWWEEEQTPSKELFVDKNYPGAVITKDSIPAEQTTTQPISSLLEQDDPKIGSMLDAVGTHYEGDPPARDQMVEHLREAMRKRRLSDAAMDDL